LEKESQQSFLKSREHTYRELADLLISEGCLPEVQQVLDLLKEEAYFEFVRRDAQEADTLKGRVDRTPVEAEWEKRYRQIADLVTAIGTVALGEAFTAESMLATLRRQYTLVHIASHFQFRPGNETDSFLLLGDGKHLTLSKIKTLPNVFDGVELLTLSACNTAMGDTRGDGKEVEGFGVLAQRLGANAVVASLWPVADESTKLLMQEFYRLRQAKAGTSKAEALCQAQLELLHGGKKSYAHPYYWALFILIGNWL